MAVRQVQLSTSELVVLPVDVVDSAVRRRRRGGSGPIREVRDGTCRYCHRTVPTEVSVDGMLDHFSFHMGSMRSSDLSLKWVVKTC